MILLFALLLQTAPAGAECLYIGEGLQQKVKEYKHFRDENAQTLAALLATETSCQSQGAQISGKIAGAAAALSCEAQFDAAEMNQQLNVLGTRCESNFTQLNALQTKIRAKFEEVQTDLEDGMEYMKKSKILQEFCMPEIKATRKMVEEFVLLEQNIVGVEQRSGDGKANYGRFAEMAQQLNSATTARGKSCGENAAMAANAVASLVSRTRGAGAAAPAGKPENAPSDVTGVERARRLAAESDRVLRDQKAPKLEIPAFAAGRDSGGEAPGTRDSAISGRSPSSLPRAVAAPSSFSGELPAASASGRPAAPSAARSASQSVGAVLWNEAGESSKLGLELSPATAASVSAPVVAAAAPVDAGSGSGASSATPDPERQPGALAGAAAPTAPGSEPGAGVVTGEEQDLFARVHGSYRRSEQFRSSGTPRLALGEGL